jgi:hypothetical protein
VEEDHGGAVHNAIVASSTGSTLVYRDAQLVWAARGDQVDSTRETTSSLEGALLKPLLRLKNALLKPLLSFNG